MVWPQPPRIKHGAAESICPNCGGSGLPAGALWREWKTGKTFQSADMLDAQSSNIILVGFPLALGSIATLVLGPTVFWWGMGAGVILALVTITVLVSRNVQRSNRAYHVVRFKCRRCLHEWEQEDGKAPPRYNERQELLSDYRAAYNPDQGPDNSDN